MRALILAGALGALWAGSAGAAELLTNGGFELPLETGWVTEIDGAGVTIDRQTYFDTDLDYEARITKTTGLGSGRVGQIVAVPGPDATFRVELNTSADAIAEAWAVAGVMLTYYDAGGGAIGETFIGSIGGVCPWMDSPTFHMIPTEPGVWEAHNFTLQDELIHLPGVDAGALASVRIALYSYAYDC